MPSRHDLKVAQQLTAQLLDLVQANQQIAVMRIKKQRAAIVQSRALLEGLARTYHIVRTSYHKLKTENPAQDSAALLLSTSRHLAGPISTITVNHFLAHAARHQHEDIIIIGDIGQERWQAAYPARLATFIDLPETGLTPDLLAPVIRLLLRYQQVTVFYPKFENLVQQQAAHTQLGTQTAAANIASANRTPSSSAATQYIFEPSLPELAAFFNEEILLLLLLQLVGEADLALIGSRITAMETAAENIAGELQRLERTRDRHSRKQRNDAQRERLAGRQLWST